jgi:hypothetical protein
MKKHNLNQTVRSWLPLAAGLTLATGFAYAAVQQSYRQTANDPQIQLASDGVRALKGGAAAANIVGPTRVDPAFSLAPFTMVFNETEAVAASGVALAEQVPSPPKGVFEYTKQHGIDKFTWEPAGGVRIAAVMQYVGEGKGFVLSGRSLGEVEKRIERINQLTGVALVVMLGVTLGLLIIL